jgi:hypothetical protein
LHATTADLTIYARFFFVQIVWKRKPLGEIVPKDREGRATKRKEAKATNILEQQQRWLPAVTRQIGKLSVSDSVLLKSSTEQKIRKKGTNRVTKLKRKADDAQAAHKKCSEKFKEDNETADRDKVQQWVDERDAMIASKLALLVRKSFLETEAEVHQATLQQAKDTRKKIRAELKRMWKPASSFLPKDAIKLPEMQSESEAKEALRTANLGSEEGESNVDEIIPVLGSSELEADIELDATQGFPSSMQADYRDVVFKRSVLLQRLDALVAGCYLPVDRANQQVEEHVGSFDKDMSLSTNQKALRESLQPLQSESQATPTECVVNASFEAHTYAKPDELDDFEEECASVCKRYLSS